MQEKISVIIPIYNSEKYLKDCLETVCNQTIFGQLEIILVDDGSMDSSPKICDEFAKKHKNIIVFHKKNEGVSKARNFGINKSKGEYIIFIDSDDIIASNYIETLYNLIVEYEADISMCNIIIIDEKQKEQINKYYKKIKETPEITVMNKNEYISNILNEKKYYTYATNKLIKKATLKNIRFRENIFYNEDGLFFLDLSNNIEKAIFVYPLYAYFYIQSSNNAHSQKFNDRYLTVIDSFKEMEKYFNIFNEKNKCYFAYRYIWYSLEANYYLKKCERIKKINNKSLRNIEHKYIKYALKSDNLSTISKIKFILKIVFPNLVMNIKERKK